MGRRGVRSRSGTSESVSSDRSGADPGSSGLSIEVTGGALGARGSIHYSRGYAATLDKLVQSFLRTDGSISARSNGIDASIRTIDKRREEMERRLVDVEARMRAQFTALDTLLGKMQTTSTFLAQQLAKLDAETK